MCRECAESMQSMQRVCRECAESMQVIKSVPLLLQSHFCLRQRLQYFQPTVLPLPLTACLGEHSPGVYDGRREREGGREGGRGDGKERGRE